MFRFKQFEVYKQAIQFSKEVRKIDLPKEELFGIRSQLLRAADSIALNIAEGSDKYSDKDFSRFLNQANGSVSETVACLGICLNAEYIDEKQYNEYLLKIEQIYKQLKAFCVKVRKDSRS